MGKFDMELALYIVQLKIKTVIEENKDKETKEVQQMIKALVEEREQIYLKNQKIIDKALNEYSKQVK